MSVLRPGQQGSTANGVSTTVQSHVPPRSTLPPVPPPSAAAIAIPPPPLDPVVMRGTPTSGIVGGGGELTRVASQPEFPLGQVRSSTTDSINDMPDKGKLVRSRSVSTSVRIPKPDQPNQGRGPPLPNIPSSLLRKTGLSFLSHGHTQLPAEPATPRPIAVSMQSSPPSPGSEKHFAFPWKKHRNALPSSTPLMSAGSDGSGSELVGDSADDSSSSDSDDSESTGLTEDPGDGTPDVDGTKKKKIHKASSMFSLMAHLKHNSGSSSSPVLAVRKDSDCDSLTPVVPSPTTTHPRHLKPSTPLPPTPKRSNSPVPENGTQPDQPASENFHHHHKKASDSFRTLRGTHNMPLPPLPPQRSSSPPPLPSARHAPPEHPLPTPPSNKETAAQHSHVPPAQPPPPPPKSKNQSIDQDQSSTDESSPMTPPTTPPLDEASTSPTPKHKPGLLRRLSHSSLKKGKKKQGNKPAADSLDALENSNIVVDIFHKAIVEVTYLLETDQIPKWQNRQRVNKNLDVPTSITLQAIFENPPWLLSFKEFVDNEFAAENLSFVREVNTLQLSVKKLDEFQIDHELKRICKKYINEESQMEVNISSDVRMDIKQTIYGTSEPSTPDSGTPDIPPPALPTTTAISSTASSTATASLIDIPPPTLTLQIPPPDITDAEFIEICSADIPPPPLPASSSGSLL
ncbi:hypothetical protein Pelo_12885 [Pelomyxa schiedti]|nr:hypothetical protein Pelo_12885 [Pelomyxa schiedti]